MKVNFGYQLSHKNRLILDEYLLAIIQEEKRMEESTYNGENIDEKVRNFLEEMMTFDIEKFNMIKELRNIVFTNLSETTERMMYGGIMFTGEKDWGGIFASKNHISFEFTEGYKMIDPDKHLEGTGKKRRHLKIKSLSDIVDKKVDVFVKQVRNPVSK